MPRFRWTSKFSRNSTQIMTNPCKATWTSTHPSELYLCQICDTGNENEGKYAELGESNLADDKDKKWIKIVYPLPTFDCMHGVPREVGICPLEPKCFALGLWPLLRRKMIHFVAK